MLQVETIWKLPTQKFKMLISFSLSSSSSRFFFFNLLFLGFVNEKRRKSKDKEEKWVLKLNFGCGTKFHSSFRRSQFSEIIHISVNVSRTWQIHFASKRTIEIRVSPLSYRCVTTHIWVFGVPYNTYIHYSRGNSQLDWLGIEGEREKEIWEITLFNQASWL